MLFEAIKLVVLHAIELYTFKMVDVMYILQFVKKKIENSLVAQWLRLCAPSAGAWVSIPNWGTKIPSASRCSQKEKEKTLPREENS